MNARHDNTDGPEDIDAAFAEIVAGLEQDEPLARWPDEEEPGRGADTATTETPQASADGERTGPRDWAPSESEEDEGHFEPPEPPPLPTPRPATLGGIALIGLGVVLLLMPSLAGLTTTIALPMALVLISSGIGWLLLRLRHDPPQESAGDDGAQL